jgi:translocation and assembly module TamB
MSRWLKIFLSLLAVVLLALGSLPWWLGAALPPILHTWHVSFERYERVGYTSFKLYGAQCTYPAVVVTAAEVQADTPVLWLTRWLRGREPLITVDRWAVRHTPNSSPTPPSTKKSIDGMPDLQRLLIHLVPILHRWLPHVILNHGELRGITPEMTLTQADWHETTLKVDGLQMGGWKFASATATATGGNFTVTGKMPENSAQLQVVWTTAGIEGTGTWWDQPFQVKTRFPDQGWIPSDARVVAENWRIPAARVKLGTPYAQVTGSARASWQNEAWELSAQASAVPALKTKAPPFNAEATAHGTLRELTLTALKLNAPFATSVLTAPVTFGFDHPLAAQSAQLTVEADLAKLPWLEAHGQVKGMVSVSGDSIAARQVFQLEGNAISLGHFAVAKATARGELAWPLLKVEEISAQLDATSSFTAHGAIDWQSREITDGALKATLTPAWFSAWLPKGASWSEATLAATAEGPLLDPHHRGSLQLSQALWPPLHPLAIDTSWQGHGTEIETLSGKVTAGQSSLAFAGTLNAQGAQLTQFAFTASGQPIWQLAAPAQFSWGPAWQIGNLKLVGSASQLSLAVHGGDDGAVELTATQFDSLWLQDWISLSGPHWQLRALNASGRVVEGAIAFKTTAAALIDMAPRPAEVQLSASGDRHGVQLQELTVTESGRILTQAKGQLPVSWKIQPTLHAEFDDSAPLDVAASTDPDSPLWAALASFSGLKLVDPSASIHVKGTLREPAGELQARAAAVSVTLPSKKFSVPDLADLILTLQFGRDSVTLKTLVTKFDGQAIEASGHLPMSDARWQQLWQSPTTLDWSQAEARIEIPDADLAVLARRMPDFIAPAGRLQAHVALSPGAKFSGALQLTNASSRPLPPFGTLQDISADIALADRTFTLRAVNAKLGGEPVTLDGTVTLVPDHAPQLSLGLKGKNLPLVRSTGLLVRTDIDLRAKTDDAGVTKVAGTVTLRDSLVLANLAALLPTGQRGVTRQPPYFAVDAEPFRHWPLAVEVRGPQAVRIRTAVFNGTASARFQLSGTLGEPRAVGDLSVDRGQVLFPFATFTVQNGTVRLRESDPFHAAVNVTALSQRRDYQLRLEATGQLPTPTITLTSSPALEAEEVLLMVMTGQPPVTQSSATAANPTASASGQRLALLGAYLGRGLFADLGIGGEDRLEISSGEQISDQGRETYEFEYKLDKRWSLTGEYDRFDSYNAGVKWRVYTDEGKKK